MELNRFRDAAGGFVQSEGNVRAYISATRPASSTPSLSEDIAEDVTEGGEDIFDVGELRSLLPVDSGMTEPVVASAFLGIVEDFECLGGFFEASERFFVPWIAIRMAFDGDLAIRCRNLTIVGCPIDAEYLVIASGSVCHKVGFPSRPFRRLTNRRATLRRQVARREIVCRHLPNIGFEGS